MVHNCFPLPGPGLELADRLADLYRQDEDRRERQRRLQQQHAEECGGECWCSECVCGGECWCSECVYGDGPVLLADIIAEAFAVRGIAAARPPVDKRGAADDIAEPAQ